MPSVKYQLQSRTSWYGDFGPWINGSGRVFQGEYGQPDSAECSDIAQVKKWRSRAIRADKRHGRAETEYRIIQITREVVK